MPPILHRDLAARNLLVGDYDRTESTYALRVADFGLALREQDRGKGHGYLGTPAYMSPEQAAGKVDELGPATDVYAVGCCLFTLISGRPPFPVVDDNPMGVILQHMRDEPPRALPAAEGTGAKHALELGQGGQHKAEGRAGDRPHAHHAGTAGGGFGNVAGGVGKLDLDAGSAAGQRLAHAGQGQAAPLPFVQRKAKQRLHLGHVARGGGLRDADPCRRHTKRLAVVQLGQQPQLDRLQLAQQQGEGLNRSIHGISVMSGAVTDN